MKRLIGPILVLATVVSTALSQPSGGRTETHIPGRGSAAHPHGPGSGSGSSSGSGSGSAVAPASGGAAGGAVSPGSGSGSGSGSGNGSGSDAPQTGSDECPSTTPDDLTAAYKVFHQDHTSLPEDGIFETKTVGNTLYVVIGPDGHLRGSMPTTVHETDDIDVLVYSAKGSKVAIEVSNCELPGVSVLGSPADLHLRDKTQPNVTAELKTYGHCAGSKVVSIKATPGDGKKCNATTTTVQTLTVYRLTVGLGGALYAGDVQKVGVDVGTGGTPNKAFQRSENRGMQTKVIVGFFPWGYSSDVGLFDHRSLFFGTAIDSSSALSSANVLAGYELVTGLAIFGGLQFAEEEPALGGALKNGAIFTDDSSKLPSRQEWVWTLAPFVGVAVTADLLAKIAK